jgi:hypothetical protein
LDADEGDRIHHHHQVFPTTHRQLNLFPPSLGNSEQGKKALEFATSSKRKENLGFDCDSGNTPIARSA